MLSRFFFSQLQYPHMMFLQHHMQLQLTESSEWHKMVSAVETDTGEIELRTYCRLPQQPHVFPTTTN